MGFYDLATFKQHYNRAGRRDFFASVQEDSMVIKVVFALHAPLAVSLVHSLILFKSLQTLNSQRNLKMSRHSKLKTLKLEGLFGKGSQNILVCKCLKVSVCETTRQIPSVGNRLFTAWLQMGNEQFTMWLES